MFALLGLLVLLSPIAQGAEGAAVAGEVRFRTGVHVQGLASMETSDGVLDLSADALAGRPIPLSWTSASGWDVTSTWVRLDSPAGPANAAPKPKNDTLGYEAGRLASVACGATCRVVLFGLGEDSRLSLGGDLDGRLRRIDASRRFWSEFSEPGPDSFYHEVPAGAFVAGADPAGTRLGGPLARADGRVGLLLIDAVATVDVGGGTVEVGRLHQSQPVHGPAGVALGAVDAVGFTYLELSDGSLQTPPGSAAVLLAPAPVLRLDGVLATTQATGTLTTPRGVERFEHEPLRIDGNLTFAFLPTESLPLGLLPDPTTEARVDGEARSLQVGRERVLSAGPSAKTVATGLSVAAVLGALWLVAQRVLTAPLYSRLNPSRIMTNDRRRRIHGLLAEHPGATPSDLARLGGIPRVVVQHHLRVLESHGIVTLRRDGPRSSYYLVGAVPSPEVLRSQAALRDETRKRIAHALVAAPAPLTQGTLADATGFSQRLVSYHLSRLTDQGLVTTEGTLPRRYVPTPLLRSALPAEQAGAA